MSSGVFRPRGYRSVRVCLTMSFTWVTVWTITVQRCRNRRGPLSQSVLRFHSRLTVHATLDQIGQKSAIVTKYFFRCKRSVGFVVFRCRDFCSHSIGDLDWHPHTLLSVSVVWLIRRCIWSSIDLFFFWDSYSWTFAGRRTDLISGPVFPLHEHINTVTNISRVLFTRQTYTIQVVITISFGNWVKLWLTLLCVCVLEQRTEG